MEKRVIVLICSFGRKSNITKSLKGDGYVGLGVSIALRVISDAPLENPGGSEVEVHFGFFSSVDSR